MTKHLTNEEIIEFLKARDDEHGPDATFMRTIHERVCGIENAVRSMIRGDERAELDQWITDTFGRRTGSWINRYELSWKCGGCNLCLSRSLYRCNKCGYIRPEESSTSRRAQLIKEDADRRAAPDRCEWCSGRGTNCTISPRCIQLLSEFKPSELDARDGHTCKPCDHCAGTCKKVALDRVRAASTEELFWVREELKGVRSLYENAKANTGQAEHDRDEARRALATVTAERDRLTEELIKVRSFATAFANIAREVSHDKK